MAEKEIKCGSYGRCGACQMLSCSYPEQLARKKAFVEDAFRAKGIRIKVNDVAGMADPYNYRNKVITYVSSDKGRIRLGMYEESSHKVVPVQDCALQNGTLNTILNSIREELDRLKIRADGYGGVLKNILLRIGVKTGQVLVVFVTSEEMFHGRNDLVKRLTARHPEIRTIIQNINPRNTSVVLGDRERVLYGTGFICDRLFGNSFKISAKSFYQVNAEQMEVLYSTALGLAGIKDTDIVLDAYCGIGTIGITAASKAGKVIGVEVNRDAVMDAISNSKYNHIDNTRFYCDDAGRFMSCFDGHVDVLVIDPPRSGCDAAFIKAIKELQPRKIVYISCNPVTQADDISRLTGIYKVSEAYPVDMFPHTSHIENVVLLSISRL